MKQSWKEVKVIESTDQNVRKYVFDSDSAVAEAVLYKYPEYRDRTVICCSTQSGCPVGCRFCGAGDNFIRSLTAGEIISQVMRCIEDTGVDPQEMDRLQIMFMSMGEPLLNLHNLNPAMHQLHKLYPNAALLISTSAPAIKEHGWWALNQTSIQIPTVGLQFSVHETTDEARDNLIPFKKKLTLKQIAGRGKAWHQATGRRPFFNYCVHSKNNTQDDANRLLALFDPSIWECTLSVVCERDEHVAAANQRQLDLVNDFSSKMLEHGFNVRVFNPAGQDDIGGGCGQLWFVQDWMDKHPSLAIPSCGSGKPKVHTPRPREADLSPAQKVLFEVLAERQRQDEKWGEQNHPLVDERMANIFTPYSPMGMARFYGIHHPKRAKVECEAAFDRNQPTYYHILMEEVAEVLESNDPIEQRKELVQVAAVAVAAIESLDRNELHALTAPIEDVNQALRDMGIDPEEVGKRGAELEQKLRDNLAKVAEQGKQESEVEG